MKKICVVTGTRADYGLLYWLIKGIKGDIGLQLQLCATGMHLSPEFGLTFKQIELDGFFIDEKVEMLLSSDTPVGISKSIGLGIIGFAEAFNRLNPDLVLILGDRYEVYSAATAAMVLRIPIAHCHGGETTEGVIDESIRHSITKMSHLHFTSTEDYRRRVIQLGEHPSTVFNVGALGIENIKKLNLLSRSELEKSIDFKLGELNFVVTFHPVTLDRQSAESQFWELLKSLDTFPNASIIFTKPNSDTDGRIIIKMIDDYVASNRERATSFISLGQLRYLSLLKYTNIVIGNSSSGLLEVPSFRKPTINIGDRQKGRIFGSTVINCDATTVEITSSIQKALSAEFQNSLVEAVNPYDKGNSSGRILEVLNNVVLEKVLKKQFYNLSQ